MNELKDFFVASVGAAAALIGLLFVAITLAPEKIFGLKADSTQHGRASGAFIALANVFFVSLAALLPRYVGAVIVVVSLSSMWQIGRESLRMNGRFKERRGRHRFGLTSFAIYALKPFLPSA